MLKSSQFTKKGINVHAHFFLSFFNLPHEKSQSLFCWVKNFSAVYHIYILISYYYLTILMHIKGIFLNTRFSEGALRWHNGYHYRKWKWQRKFKAWTGLFAFDIALSPLGKEYIQLFSPQLSVNSRVDSSL